MGRKRINEELRKESITISLPKYLITAIRQIPDYNKLISQLIENYLRNK